MSEPGGDPSSGISSGDALILPERHPACRRREARPGFRMERENLRFVTSDDVKGQAASGSNREGESTEAERRGGAARSSDEGRVMGLERRGCVVQPWPLVNWKQDEPVNEAKPFKIPKRDVWEAFKRVKANQGAAGVDGQSIAEFEANLAGNLYKLWNRLSSGSYFPPPVLRVDIPKADGGEVGRAGHMGKRSAVVELLLGNMGSMQRETRPSMQREDQPTMATELEQIAVKARREPNLRFTSLAHHITRERVQRNLQQIPKHSAAGVDGQTVEGAKESFEEWIGPMLDSVHRQGYRAPNIRRVYIPKPGKTEKRPLGVPTVSDRALQRSTAEVLSAIYEQDFLSC